MRKFKNKRGFSLVELMVVVAIMGTLAAIAIPAYNEYRKAAKKTAYRTDLLGLHKGWQAFGVELDSYCERSTSPQNASIENVGMKSLQSSKLYGSSPGKNNFIGFEGTAPASDACPTVNSVNLYTASNAPEKINENNTITGDGCELAITSYKLGVIGHLYGEKYIPTQVDQNGVVKENSEVTNPGGTQVVCT